MRHQTVYNYLHRALIMAAICKSFLCTLVQPECIRILRNIRCIMCSFEFIQSHYKHNQGYRDWFLLLFYFFHLCATPISCLSRKKGASFGFWFRPILGCHWSLLFMFHHFGFQLSCRMEIALCYFPKIRQHIERESQLKDLNPDPLPSSNLTKQPH